MWKGDFILGMPQTESIVFSICIVKYIQYKPILGFDSLALTLLLNLKWKTSGVKEGVLQGRFSGKIWLLWEVLMVCGYIWERSSLSDTDTNDITLYCWDEL